MQPKTIQAFENCFWTNIRFETIRPLSASRNCNDNSLLHITIRSNHAVHGQQAVSHNTLSNYVGHDLGLALSALIEVGGVWKWPLVSAWPRHWSEVRGGQSNVPRGGPTPPATRTPYCPDGQATDDQIHKGNHHSITRAQESWHQHQKENFLSKNKKKRTFGILKIWIKTPRF